MQKFTELVAKVEQVQNQLTQGTFPRSIRGVAFTKNDTKLRYRLSMKSGQ